MWSFDRYANAAEIVIAGNYEPDAPLVTLQVQSSNDLKSWADVEHPPITTPRIAADFFRLKITTPAP
jgi:hypothetical protein